MIKKNLIFYTTIILTTTFLLCSCANEISYKNVDYTFNREKHQFFVDVDKDSVVDYVIPDKNVFYKGTYHFINEYADHIYNEFLVKARTLYIYD